MKYTLFVGEDCHDCHLVQDFVKGNSLAIEIIDADKEADKLQFDIFVRPALMRGDTLVAYGMDVIEHLKDKVMVKD